jgi:hypothetical protein
MMMDAKHRPKLALADLVILVTASALGMAVLRTTIESGRGGYLRHVPPPYFHGWRGPLGYYHWPYYYFFILVNGLPQILVAALCVVALTLRSRRSLALPLSQRPGFVLCLAAVVASLLTTVVHGSTLRMQSYDLRLALWELILYGILPNSGFMVLGSWMALALAGRGGPTSSWLDRIGYALGASLVALLALESVRMLLEGARLV